MPCRGGRLVGIDGERRENACSVNVFRWIGQVAGVGGPREE
jgi:hypothetical protein